MYKTSNRSPGNLFVGNIDAKIGQFILIKGEDKPRRITYVMGQPEKNTVNVVMKGTGPIPTGEVEWDFAQPVTAVPPPETAEEIQARIDALNDRLAEIAEEEEEAAGEEEQQASEEQAADLGG